MAKQTKAKPRRGTTALVHSPQRGPVQVYRPRVQILPAPAGLDPHVLTDDAAIGALGTFEVKLTPAEELALSKPVDFARVLIKPSGQPYLPHAEYTRWFNEAFGRLGWAMVPCAKPLTSGTSVVCPYLLHVHGKPAAFAIGEQDYYGGAGGNREQTYGDALEATVASALRRCAKRLGVGLELWDKRWIESFMGEHGVRVRVIKNVRGEKKPAWQWRLKTDAPFYNEVTRGGKTVEGDDVDREDEDRTPEPAQRRTVAAPPAVTHAKAEEKINEAMRKRLWTIATNSGRSHEVVKAWLMTKYKLASSKDITRAQYERICTAIEASGSLPL